MCFCPLSIVCVILYSSNSANLALVIVDNNAIVNYIVITTSSPVFIIGVS